MGKVRTVCLCEWLRWLHKTLSFQVGRGLEEASRRRHRQSCHCSEVGSIKSAAGQN